MKKLSLLLSILLILCIFPVSSFAVEKDASISVSSRTKESGNIFIFAAITNITDAGGISYLEYSIKYDPAVLELKNTMVNMPDTWGADAEDWSELVADGEFSWVMFNTEIGQGIKEDNKLFIEFEFTPISDNVKTTISFECIDICGDDLLSPLSGKSGSIEISITKDSENSIVVSDSDIIESVSSSESNEESSNNTSNGGTSNSQIDSETNSSNNSANNNTTSNNNPNTESSSDIHIGSEINGDSGNNGELNILPVVIVSVVLVLIGAVVIIFVMKTKKGNAERR